MNRTNCRKLQTTLLLVFACASLVRSSLYFCVSTLYKILGDLSQQSNPQILIRILNRLQYGLNEKEAFSNLLVQAEKNKVVYGFKFSSNISITHLLFADDGLVFTKASSEGCKNLKSIFDCYASASGQIFNYNKSFMFFSSNVQAGLVDNIKRIFQLNVVFKHEKYLCLPSMVGRKKINFLNDIKLRILNKLLSWQNNFFSSEGKEVLINAVAQAIPAYTMSVFKTPLCVSEDIHKAIARFWWTSKTDHRSIHQTKWEQLCRAKRK